MCFVTRKKMEISSRRLKKSVRCFVCVCVYVIIMTREFISTNSKFMGTKK